MYGRVVNRVRDAPYESSARDFRLKDFARRFSRSSCAVPCSEPCPSSRRSTSSRSSHRASICIPCSSRPRGSWTTSSSTSRSRRTRASSASARSSGASARASPRSRTSRARRTAPTFLKTVDQVSAATWALVAVNDVRLKDQYPESAFQQNMVLYAALIGGLYYQSTTRGEAKKAK